MSRMLTVDGYGRIRRAHRDGMSIREIAREFHHSRYKVREVLHGEGESVKLLLMLIIVVSIICHSLVSLVEPSRVFPLHSRCGIASFTPA